MRRRCFLTCCLLTLFTGGKIEKLNAEIFKQKNRGLKFGIIADIHYDIAYDGAERLKKFLDAAAKENVDFIIELGDFCFPIEANRTFKKLWDDFPGNKYHVLGNHDMDKCTKEEYMQFLGDMPERYYSFDKGQFHFIVLDPNNLFTDGKYVPYQHGNFYVDRKKREYMDPEQLEWLKKDLQSTEKRCILFSHESFEISVNNGELVRSILESENKRCRCKKVIAAISGHDHTNYTKEINGITYIQINSASYKWVGEKYACKERFSEEINKKRPNLKFTLPYKDSLFAFVTLDSNSLKIKGRESEFIPPTPEDLKIPKNYRRTPMVPWVKDFKMKF